MTIKHLYPKARPHIIYNVINGRPELPAQASFSRASEATYVDRAGIIRTAAVDEPRFNYDPDTGEFLGLLLEDELQNSVCQSNSYLGWSGNGIMNPLPTNNAAIAPDGTMTAWQLPTQVASSSGTQKNYPLITDYGMLSFFVKKGSDPGASSEIYVASGNYTSPTYWANIIFNFDTEATLGGFKFIRYPNGWYRLYKLCEGGGTAAFVLNTRVTVDGDSRIGSNGTLFWGTQLERSSTPLSLPSSYIESTATSTGALPAFQRAADAFSLTSSSDFDNGFSLLLDSNTTTDDFTYKIKAGGSTIAELNNDNGTLDWVIDGTSAATSDPPQYPQIGAIQPGRVRTVSSFGAAGDGDQTNYLYTEGLSFPTVAEPAAGADELEFGPGQTVKAVYVWDGQLSNTEAVSVIKGEYNIILDEPIQADTYSFVYNTDPTNVGEASITLPYIVPTVSMRVYWGDTTSDRYEPGVTPSHTYPYPGQYRIQIEADDGFDGARLANVNNSIQRVDQWAPQHRVGAAGDGFTGGDFGSMLYYQTGNQNIPPFKYTNLTNINGCVYANVKAEPNNWDWVPTQLQNCITANNAFDNISRDAGTQVEFNSFPQLQTSSSLTSVKGCFTNCRFEYFDNDISGLPFTVTSSVTRWDTCFSNMVRLLRIGALDTSAATNLSSTFKSCTSLAAMPFIAANNVTNFTDAWSGCSSLTSFPQIDTSSGTNFKNTWAGCSGLTSFPALDFSNATSLEGTFGDTGLTSFPPVTMPTGPFRATGMFDECSDLVGGSSLDFSNCTFARALFRSCTDLSTMPAINAPNNTDLYQTYRGCLFTTVVAMNTGSVEAFSGIFQYMSALDDVSKLANWDLSSAKTFASAFNLCSSLTDFPANVFDTTGTLSSAAFDSAWKGSALTAQSIENILVSLDTNGASNITLGIDDGTNAGQSTWTAAANTAYTNLINKGWTISSNP